MVLSLPKINVKLPSTISAAVKAKPSLAAVVGVAAILSPVGAVAALGAYEVAKHPDQVKSTLSHAADSVKAAAPVVASTIGHAAVVAGKGAKSAVGAVGSGLTTLMMPLMVVGGLAVAMMILKK